MGIPPGLYPGRGRETAREVVMRGRWLGIVGALAVGTLAAAGSPAAFFPSDADVAAAFGKQGIRLSVSEASAIRGDVELALREARAHGIGNSKVDFAAVEIASQIGLDTSPGSR
jgi:hypothetical protein